MREHLGPANLLTSGGLACGFLALILASEREFGWAAAAIGAAAALDAVDGIAARLLARDGGGFGTNLDSLADLLSFGVAPALALHISLLQTAPIAGIAACLAFVVCATWRLARAGLVARSGRSVGSRSPRRASLSCSWQPSDRRASW